MDLTQITVVIATSTLCILLIILGIQVFFILKEIRISLQKVNKMLDDGGRVTGTISSSVENVSGFVNGIKAGISALTAFRNKKEEDYG